VSEVSRETSPHRYQLDQTYKKGTNYEDTVKCSKKLKQENGIAVILDREETG
jgi:hypothetical protein